MSGEVVGSRQTLRLTKVCGDSDDDDFFIWQLPSGFFVAEYLVQFSGNTADSATVGIGSKFGHNVITDESEYRALADFNDLAQGGVGLASPGEGAAGSQYLVAGKIVADTVFPMNSVIRCPVYRAVPVGFTHFIVNVQFTGISPVVCVGLVPGRRDDYDLGG